MPCDWVTPLEGEQQEWLCTECKETWIEGEFEMTPMQRKMRYCPFCGEKIGAFAYTIDKRPKEESVTIDYAFLQRRR